MKYSTVVAHAGKILLGVGLLMLLSVFATVTVARPKIAGSLTVWDDLVVERSHAFAEALRSDAASVDNVDEPTRSQVFGNVELFFEAADTDVFSARSLAAVADAQERLMALPGLSTVCQLLDGECVRPSSPLDVLAQSNRSSVCDQMSDPAFAGERWPLVGAAEAQERLYSVCGEGAECASAAAYESLVFDNQARCAAADDVGGRYTRLTLALGGPLEGFRSRSTKVSRQAEALTDQLGAIDLPRAINELKQAVEAEHDGAVTVHVSCQLCDFTTYYLMRDLIYVVLSLIVVFVAIAVQTQSMLVSLLGIVQIVMAFPMGMGMYTLLTGEREVTMLIYLALFLLLGIGADDIFLFHDTWRRSRLTVGRRLHSRLRWSYRKATTAMLVTSATTMAAFFAMTLAPVWDVRNFGMVLGCMVFCDYVLVITWLPAGVVLYERWTGSDVVGQAKDEHCVRQRAVEQWLLGSFFSRALRYRRQLLVLGALMMAVSVTLCATLLESGSKDPRYFDDDHELVQSRVVRTENFDRSPLDPAVVRTHLVYGLHRARPIDRADARQTDPYYRGIPRFTGCDFSGAEAQEGLIEVCDEVLAGALARGLVPEGDGSYCFMRDFRDWRLGRGEPFPVAEADEDIVEALLEWRYSSDAHGMINETLAANDYVLNTGFVEADGVVLMAWVGFNTTLPDEWLPGASLLGPVFDGWEALVEEQNEKRPQLRGMQTNQYWWWLVTQEALLSSAIFNSAVSLTVAAAMILLATRNLAVTALATATLTVILAVTLALCVTAADWDFSLLECMCVSLATGVAVDYTVHLAHAFTVSRGRPRSRVRGALGMVGVSVVSGAASTISSCIPLLLCELLWFRSFGVFCILLLSAAIVSSMLLMPALLLTWGPHSHPRANLTTLVPWRSIGIAPASPGGLSVETSWRSSHSQSERAESSPVPPVPSGPSGVR